MVSTSCGVDLRPNRTSTTTGDACKYLVLVLYKYNGLGKPILRHGIGLAFLCTILTDRVMFVDPGAALLGLFCEPFLGTSWLLPLVFPLEDLESLTGEVTESYWNLVRDAGSRPCPSSHTSSYTSTYKLLYCDEHLEFPHRASWLMMRTEGTPCQRSC